MDEFSLELGCNNKINPLKNEQKTEASLATAWKEVSVFIFNSGNVKVFKRLNFFKSAALNSSELTAAA